MPFIRFRSLFAICAVLLMASEWILLVAGIHVHELLVGAACVLVSTVFLSSVCKTSTLTLDFHVSDVKEGWRIPWYVLCDCVILARVLLRDLCSLGPTRSLYRVSGFKTSKNDPRMVTRRVLATVYTTTSPNSIVIGIDCKQSRLLFHQLERRAVSEMTRRLGANS